MTYPYDEGDLRNDRVPDWADYAIVAEIAACVIAAIVALMFG